MNFYVNQKVVCILGGGGIREGEVFSVVELAPCGCPAIRVHEGAGPATSCTCACGAIPINTASWYKASAFRPLLETDVHCELLADLGHRLVEEKPEHVNVPQPSRA